MLWCDLQTGTSGDKGSLWAAQTGSASSSTRSIRQRMRCRQATPLVFSLFCPAASLLLRKRVRQPDTASTLCKHQIYNGELAPGCTADSKLKHKAPRKSVGFQAPSCAQAVNSLNAAGCAQASELPPTMGQPTRWTKKPLLEYDNNGYT